MSYETSNNSENKVNSEEQKFFITDENFQKLRQLQQSIFEQTEVSPSIRKLVNLLITEENLQVIHSKLLMQLKTLKE